MSRSVGPQFQGAWNAISGNVGTVLKLRGMNVNDLASEAERKKRSASKTIYNALKQSHPPSYKTLIAIAETLEIPLWLLMIPNLPKELLDSPGRERLLRLVGDYLACDETRHKQVAEFTAGLADLCRAAKTPQ